jgi:hypothetical protein
MALSSVSVVGNALLLRRWRPERFDEGAAPPLAPATGRGADAELP